MRKKMLLEVGEKLKKIRIKTGCDRKTIAALLGVTPSAYCKNERGVYLPSLNSLIRLVENYNISIDWLLFNKGPMYYEEKRKKELELETTIDNLKTELEQERKNTEEKCNTWEQERKSLLQGSAFFESRPEAKELLVYMEQNPIFYHELMIYFQKYKLSMEKK